MKRIVFLLLLAMFILPSVVYAQSDTEDYTVVIQNSEAFEIQLAQHTQDPGTGEVKLDLAIRSFITSDRVRVTWSVSGFTELLTEEVQRLSISPGQTYIQTARIKPRNLGISQIVVKVEAFEIDGTYIATASKKVRVLPGGQVFPVTSEYTLAQALYYTRVAAMIGLGILVLFVGGQWVYRKAVGWYTDEDQEF